uniref:Protein interacting with cyclin A1 n=1 Tax=Rattus norvegicus TaxID=10116 RepID=A0A8I6A9A4_RAT
MWVRTTVTIRRWSEEKSGCNHERYPRTDITRLPSWKRGYPASVESSSDMSSFSEGAKATGPSPWQYFTIPPTICI